MKTIETDSTNGAPARKSKPDSSIAAVARAVEKLEEGTTLDNWLAIGRGLNAIRREALDELRAASTDPAANAAISSR